MAARALSRDEKIYTAWLHGHLSWVLRHDRHQLTEGYERYRAWAADPPVVEGAKYDDVYVVDWGRRTGKTTWRLLVRFEDAIRLAREIGRPAALRYASAFQKNVQEIIDDVAPFVLDTCPKDLRPEYKTANKARGAGFYFPEAAGGSYIRLVGLDKDPHGLRGRASDGDDLSEAGFIRHLTHSVKSVLLPQYQGRPWARLCLESSAPEEPDTDFDRVFVEDAKLRGAYTFATLDDNPRISAAEKEKFIREAGGRGDPVCEREYYGVRGRPADIVVIPSFDPTRHVVPLERPEYALCYTIGDAGYSPDFFAVLFGWVDYARAKLCVKGDWIRRNAGTKEVGEAIKAGEAECYAGVKRWNGKIVLHQTGAPERKPDGLWLSDEAKRDREREDALHHPYARILDGEPRLRSDLGRTDGLHFVPAVNTDPDAQFHRLNRLFADDKIEIDPSAKSVIAHTRAAHRGPNGKLARSDVHGHFDAMRCLAYFAVMADWHADPTPPAWALDPKLVATPAMKAQATHAATKAVNELVKARRWKPQRSPWRAAR